MENEAQYSCWFDKQSSHWLKSFYIIFYFKTCVCTYKLLSSCDSLFLPKRSVAVICGWLKRDYFLCIFIWTFSISFFFLLLVRYRGFKHRFFSLSKQLKCKITFYGTCYRTSALTWHQFFVIRYHKFVYFSLLWIWNY